MFFENNLFETIFLNGNATVSTGRKMVRTAYSVAATTLKWQKTINNNNVETNYALAA